MNVVPLLGHGTLRVAAMGVADRAPTADELERMTRLASESVEQGAFGLSTGLTHVPSAYATPSEVTQLASTMTRHRRIYATHARARSGWTLKAIDEAVQVGRETGVRVEFSHLAINEPDLWGAAGIVLERFESARDDGHRHRLRCLSIRRLQLRADAIPADVAPGGRNRSDGRAARTAGGPRPCPEGDRGGLVGWHPMALGSDQGQSGRGRG